MAGWLDDAELEEIAPPATDDQDQKALEEAKKLLGAKFADAYTAACKKSIKAFAQTMGPNWVDQNRKRIEEIFAEAGKQVIDDVASS